MSNLFRKSDSEGLTWKSNLFTSFFCVFRQQIERHKLEWNVESKVGSLDKADYKPGGGDKKVLLLFRNASYIVDPLFYLSLP